MKTLVSDGKFVYDYIQRLHPNLKFLPPSREKLW